MTGEDFTTTATSVTFDFAPSSTIPTPELAFIEIINDDIVEPQSEFIQFNINIILGLGILTATQETVTIADDDG